MRKIAAVSAVLLIILVIAVSVASAGTSYLPIVGKAITPTPTATPTPTPTPNPAPIWLPNGDFEQGHVAWHEYSNHAYEIIRSKTDPLIKPPHSGSWEAWLGGANSQIDKLNQTVTVPADHPYLSFWMWIDSVDFCNYDFAYLYAGTTQIVKQDLCKDRNTNNWVRKVYDLTAYRGKSIDLMISVETDSTRISSLFVDDFQFVISMNP